MSEKFESFAVTSVMSDGDVSEAFEGAIEEEGDDPGFTGNVVAGRYRLIDVLGKGGYGQVWEADDLLAGGRVALKLLSADLGPLAVRMCREVASLRLLRLPGVVRLLDEGVTSGSVFLVMERVVGTPFPGVPVPAPWERMAPTVIALLETLERVHRLGIVHRDLKPENILVGPDGAPTILDFGLSRPERANDQTITQPGMILGTPAFLAPEQVRTLPITARTDLYSLGVVLFQALSGHFPNSGEDALRMLYARIHHPAVPLLQVAPGVPAEVAEVVDALLARDPKDRPASARRVLDRLRGKGGGAHVALAKADPAAQVRARIEAWTPGAPAGEEELRALFVGRDRLFHVREDAAALLQARTKGAPDRVLEDLTGWVNAGLARWDGDGVAIERDGIEKLEAGMAVVPLDGPAPSVPPPPQARREEHRSAAREAPPGAPQRLYRLIAGAGEDLDLAAEIAAEALHLGRRLAAEGRLALAAAVASEGLRSARRLGRVHMGDALPLLVLSVELALEDGTPPALDRALYELYCTDPRAEATTPLVTLVRAALAVGQRTERSFAAASSLAPFQDPALERRRHGLRIAAARFRPQEEQEALFEEVRAWAEASGDRASQSAFAGWLGRLRYRQGRFAEAADLHLAAADGEPWITAKIMALLRSASARMEVFELERASTAALSALESARAHRLPFHEAYAEWIVRSIAYRAGEALAPDEELALAAGELRESDTEAVICLHEAAIAWRTGELALGQKLAQRAVRRWSALGEVAGGALLAGALAIACGAPSTPEESRHLLERGLGCSVPSVGLQALGLLAMGHGILIVEDARIAALLAEIPEGHREHRLEVLSIHEAVSALRRRTSSPARK